jgi:hypothetical protein
MPKRIRITQPLIALDQGPLRVMATQNGPNFDYAGNCARKPPSFAVALNCGIGSSFLKALVNAFDKLHIVRGANSSYCCSKYSRYARWLKKSVEERAAMMKPLFGNLTCEICGGTMTKVAETEAVCTQNEAHRRKLKENVSC